MELRKVTENMPIRFVSLAAVGALVFSACGSDKETPTEQLQGIYDTTSEQCMNQADSDFAEAYPDVVVSDEPTIEELEDALDSMNSRATEGEQMRGDSFDACMELNYFGFEPVEAPTDSATTTTTIMEQEG